MATSSGRAGIGELAERDGNTTTTEDLYGEVERWCMTTVEIEYCVPCGFLERAQRLQGALLSSLDDELAAVTLRTGDDGVFRVSVDDELVFEKGEEYDVDAIVRAVRERT